MKLLAVCACPMGVAHTYMAAEAIEKAAKEKGHSIKVETQGATGFDRKITNEEVKDADAIILTTDVPIRERERFQSLKIFNVSSTACIKSANKIIEAIEQQLKPK